MRGWLSAWATVIATALAGCATTEAPSDPSAEPATAMHERVERPGSHLPVKSARPMTKEEKEKQAEDARTTLSNTPRPSVAR